MKLKTVKFNLEGEVCPYPLIMAVKEFEKIKKNIISGKKVFEIVTDCPAATENIPFEFGKRGMRSEIKTIGKGRWKIIIKK